MKFCVGNDIIETKRIERLCKKFSDKFKNRVYLESEIQYCESKKENKYQSYAGRFAAKEAIYKAISGKLDNKYSVSWTDIEIINDESGRPFVKLKGMDFVEEIDVSISHVKEYAIATAIVTFK
ncbi:MAG: holo-ACP synthase [Clostridia bacterium]|nr:holo-ACP synthase [Clostridia bacterium]